MRIVPSTDHHAIFAWYVDDLKISHKDTKVVSDVIEKFEEPVGKMTVTRGREHKFLGMKIRYNEN